MSGDRTNKSRFRKIDRACIIDGESDPERLQRHRVGGIEVTLCRRCHRKLIERSTRPPCPIWTPPDDLELIGRALLAEADLLSLLAQSRWVLAHALIDRVRREAPHDDPDDA